MAAIEANRKSVTKIPIFTVIHTLQANGTDKNSGALLAHNDPHAITDGSSVYPDGPVKTPRKTHSYFV